MAGITSETGDLGSELQDARATIEGWLKDLGVDPQTAKQAQQDASASASDMVSTLLSGLGAGLKELSSLVFFLAMTALSLVFLLADGPRIRAWGKRHMGVAEPVARTISSRTLESLRGYFVGVTLVAAFNAAVVGHAGWGSAESARGTCSVARPLRRGRRQAHLRSADGHGGSG